MSRTNQIFCHDVVVNRNIDSLDQVYTADARILPPGAPQITGRAAIKDFWATLVQSADVKAAILESVEVMPEGDGVVEIGRARLTLPDSEMQAKYVVYWRQEDGHWKWHVDIWNAA